MADRAFFIQELIAALQENGQGAATAAAAVPAQSEVAGEDGEATAAAAAAVAGLFLPVAADEDEEDLAEAAYDRLQFDFPIVADAQLLALARAYKSLGSKAAQFPLTLPLLNGIAYLNDQQKISTSVAPSAARGSEASALLAASVLLNVLRYCLENPETSLTKHLLAKLQLPETSQRPKTQDQWTPAALAAAADKLTSEQAQAAVDHSSIVEEIYAAEEDPDDLSLVYEGDHPAWRTTSFPTPSPAQAKAHASFNSASSMSLVFAKLRYLATLTFSSAFMAISVEKWDEWQVDATLESIMRQLVSSSRNELELQLKASNSQDSVGSWLFGAQGEWSSYLFLLRDRLLRFPESSASGVWRLKELVTFLQPKPQPFGSKAKQQNEPKQEGWAPHCVVYRVLAELAAAKEFRIPRAQQGLSRAVLALLPQITVDLQTYGDVEHGDLIVMLLQLVHFPLQVSPNVNGTVEQVYASGTLRTLLSLARTLTTAKKQDEQELEPGLKVVRWFWMAPLLRVVGESALWHSEFAEYLARVPHMAALLPTLTAHLPAETTVIFLAFHQHRVASNAANAAPVDVWQAFSTESLFPLQCESYLDAMQKV